MSSSLLITHKNFASERRATVTIKGHLAPKLSDTTIAEIALAELAGYSQGFVVRSIRTIQTARETGATEGRHVELAATQDFDWDDDRNDYTTARMTTESE